MARESAGLLLHRRRSGRIEVLLVHPGGPFWAKKDQGAWSIPKGEIEPGEDPLARALTELEEETGLAVTGPFTALAPLRQPGGKRVQAWAAPGDADPVPDASNFFRLEWPPGSGDFRDFPEVDRAQWFDLATARAKILKGQAPLLDQLEALLGEA
jgi:predicted NUDIX family NTP pyrophosphohydrolase